MRKHIINVAEIELEPRPPERAPSGPAAERFDARIARIGSKIGARKLGYTLVAVPPGKRAFPFHSHRAQEEMFYVIEGAGEARIGAERFPIRAGDIIACPPGGPETAHQIINTGKSELRYLAVSTMEFPEVCEYPDSAKLAAFGESLRFIVRSDREVGYWEGE